MISFHLLITGKVQEVFFRASAKEVANKHYITGWIRNTKEGHVDAMISGTEEATAKFIEWCKRGPVNASVDQVTTEPVNYIFFSAFLIKR